MSSLELNVDLICIGRQQTSQSSIYVVCGIEGSNNIDIGSQQYGH